MWAEAKRLAPVKVMLHCCGAVRQLLPDLIDAGLDAINPVQISGKGMEAEGLKRDFGAKLAFWGGGCDTQRVLPLGKPDEVRAHVRAQCAAFAPGGGFVFQQVHNILAGVPPEKYCHDVRGGNRSYCLMIVPSRRAHFAPAAIEPFALACSNEPNGYFAAAFSSISMPQPGASLAKK